MTPIFADNVEIDEVFLDGVEVSEILEMGDPVFTHDMAPTIETFTVVPQFLVDSAQVQIEIQATFSQDPGTVTLTEGLIGGANTTVPFTADPGDPGTYDVVRPQPPATDALYTVSAVSAGGHSASKHLRWYRWLTPTVGITADAPATGGSVIQFARVTLHMTRTGRPLPTVSITSSAGTHVPPTAGNAIDNDGDWTSRSVTLQRTLTVNHVDDVITISGYSELPITTNPSRLNAAAATVSIRWPGLSE